MLQPLSYHDHTESQKDIAELMRVFMQRLISLDRAEKVCHHVTLSQAHTIGAIHQHGMISMNELSQELGLAISTLTRINDVLVRDGIVCRNACKTDRRKVNLCLTPKGSELAITLNTCSTRFWEKIIIDIPDDKRSQVMESLELILNSLGKIEGSCCQKDE